MEKTSWNLAKEKQCRGSGSAQIRNKYSNWKLPSILRFKYSTNYRYVFYASNTLFESMPDPNMYPIMKLMTKPDPDPKKTLRDPQYDTRFNAV